jgi:uncharacterized protein
MLATKLESAPSSDSAQNVRWPVSMRWQNLLFAHWPIEPEKIRGLLPPNLELDTYDGRAWIGIVPFYLTIRLNWMPCAFEFLEVNVRTYAKHDGKSGVWFLSLDASSRLAVTTARLAYCLPYHKAKMKMQIDRQSAARWIQFSSRRTDRSTAPAAIELEYGPIGEQFHAEPGSLDHWLTERYSLFAVNRKGAIASADVEHVLWPLRRAEAAFKTNTMLQPLGLKIPSIQPLLHFAHDLSVVAGTLRADESTTAQSIVVESVTHLK